MKPSTDTVPAMLTPGEFVIRKDAAEEIGPEKLHMLNNIDRLGQSALLENAKSPMGYQEGGVISGMTGDTAEKYSDLKSLFGGKQRFSDLSDEDFEKTSDQLFEFIRGRRKMGELVAKNPELQGPSGMDIRKEDDKKLLEKSLSKIKADYTPTEQAYLESLPAQEKIARKYNILAEAGLPQKPQARTSIVPDFSGLDTSMRKPQFVDPRDSTMRDTPYVKPGAGPTETMLPADFAMPSDWTNQFELPETVEDWGPAPEQPKVSWGDLSAYDKLGLMLMGENKWDSLRGKSRRIMSGKEGSFQGYDYEVPGVPTFREALGLQEGGQVMHNKGQGQMNEVLSLFGEKSQDADGLQKLAALATMQRALDIQKAIKAHGEGMATHTMPDGTVMPGATHEEYEAMGMRGGGYVPQYQEGGSVEPPMPTGEQGPQQAPMSSGQQAYYKPPMEQLGMDEFEYSSYIKYGPDMYKYFPQNFKPKEQWTAYDSLVSDGIIDPYKVSKDSINVLTDDQLNELLGQRKSPQ